MLRGQPDIPAKENEKNVIKGSIAVLKKQACCLFYLKKEGDESMFTRMNGFVIHTPTQTKATFKELLYYQKLTGEKARCGKCKRILRPGDYLDHHFPHEVSQNRCKECYSIEEKERMSNPRLQELREKILETAFDDF